MYRERVTLIVAIFLLMFVFACDDSDSDSGSSTSESQWVFTDDGVELGISGVSPEAILLNDGSVRLYVTDLGIKVYVSSDGLTFTVVGASPPQGSDPTLILLDDGTYRMYFVKEEDGNQEIWTAISPDGLSFTEESGTGIKNTSGSVAWGVPDSVKTPNGSVRLYWVDDPTGASASDFEVIKSAIAEDGLTFTIEDGFRTEDGFVDPYILKAEDENWVGLFATTPEVSRLPQEIYVGTSTDGLTWTIESVPIITISGGNVLDPTAVSLGDGSYRVYYSATPDTDPFSGHSLKSGILRQRNSSRLH